MFDTSVVRARAIAAPRRATLVVSIAVHSIAVIAAVALSVTTTRVPSDPPKQYTLYRPAEIPSPPPAPLGVRRPAAALPEPRPALEPPHEVTAPPAIPDQVPSVPAATTATSLAPATETSGPIGDPNGVPNGVDTGLHGGTGTGTGIAQQGPFMPGVGGVTAARVLTRVQPDFPDRWRGAVRDATVVVRCVIGADGRIHDPEIVMSSFPPFNDSVMKALRQWTFAPGMANGQPVDTYFELRVKFEVR